ncbi:MAG: hypothetical protein IPI89_13850 [Propionivibrio sp.]|nr:hypothetical protein [Propionivibrio sp.]
MSYANTGPDIFHRAACRHLHHDCEPSRPTVASHAILPQPGDNARDTQSPDQHTRSDQSVRHTHRLLVVWVAAGDIFYPPRNRKGRQQQLNFKLASGIYRCERGQKVEVQRDARNANLIKIDWQRSHYTLHRYDSTLRPPLRGPEEWFVVD